MRIAVLMSSFLGMKIVVFVGGGNTGTVDHISAHLEIYDRDMSYGYNCPNFSLEYYLINEISIVPFPHHNFYVEN